MRFFCRYNAGDIGTHLDPATLAAVVEYKHLEGVSPERIAVEFLAGLQQAVAPVTYLKNYAVLDLYPAAFPGLAVDVHDLERIDGIRNPRAVLAWLLKGTGDPRKVKNHLNRCKFSGEIFDRVEFLLHLYRFEPAQVLKYLRHRDLYKQEKDPEVRLRKQKTMEQDVRDFARLAGRQEELEHFLRYLPVTRSEDFRHLQGRAITQAMAEAEARAYEDSYHRAR